MTKRWRIHEETLAEIDATVAWYGAQRAGLGLEFFDDLRATVAELREAPAISTPDPTAANTGMIVHWDGKAWTTMPSPTITYAGEQQAGNLKWISITGRARPRRN